MKLCTTFAILVSVFSFAFGYKTLLRQILGQSLMGNWLSTLPSRFQCIGAGDSNFTNFMLFSRVHPSNHRPIIPHNRDLLHKSDFDPTIPTKVIIHGFVDNIFISDWMQRMKDAFLSEGEYNVVITDWGCGNEFPYFQAVQKSKTVADELKNLITFLRDTTGAESSSFHLIGHSLGSHIAARVGHALTPRLGRISGLDPAGPRFFQAPMEDRLDASDAEFVDVIHTDSGHGLLEGLGMRSAVGHVDFYPNGGSSQPGCHSSPFSILPRIGIHRAGRYYLTCDHFRSIEFYIESIKSILQPRSAEDASCVPIGVGCRDWETYEQGRCADCSHPGDCAIMGYHSDLFFDKPEGDTKHELYLKTSEEKPFCLFQYQVIVETACDFSSCDNDNYPEFNPGVLRLEMQVKKGKIARLVLDDKSEHSMKPGAQYVYLATSRFPLGKIEGAKVWWGYVSRPDAVAGPSHYTSGLNLKSIQIHPITGVDKVDRLSQPEVNVLCGPPNITIGRNQYLELSMSGC